MKKFGRDTIQCIVDRAIMEFMNDIESPEFVSFLWKGHHVEAFFEWDSSCCSFFLSDFIVVYNRCVMKYVVDEDFDRSIAWCE